jgi:hypothetical protein
VNYLTFAFAQDGASCFKTVIWELIVQVTCKGKIKTAIGWIYLIK